MPQVTDITHSCIGWEAAWRHGVFVLPLNGDVIVGQELSSAPPFACCREDAAEGTDGIPCPPPTPVRTSPHHDCRLLVLKISARWSSLGGKTSLISRSEWSHEPCSLESTFASMPSFC